ncbi:uncharacterized protein CBL_03544 [Carabus blaptoides fortunei]
MIRHASSRPTTPIGIDWFNQHARVQSLDRQMLPLMIPPRQEYGGNYGADRGQYSGNRAGNSRGNRGGPRQPRGDRSHMGFQKLEKLNEMEPDQLVVVLANEDVGLEKLFKTDLTPDYIVLILRVISKLCESTFQENKGSLLVKICQRDFIDKLIKYLSELVVQEPYEKQRNKFYWQDQDRFWNDLLILFETVLLVVPNTACEVLPKLVKHTCISVGNMEKHQHVIISDTVKTKLEELQVKVMMCVEEREKKKVVRHEQEDDREAPNNFREISLYPTVDEITTHSDVFLRKNIVSGSYKDVEHYLDVQFRLLREDFVAPLRDGICEYIAQIGKHKGKRLFNVRVYKNIRFVGKHQVQDKVCLLVQFMQPSTSKKKINYEHSRRFMFGSLMCFTSNMFRSVVFGTVAERKEELLQKGMIAVDILEDVDYNLEYTMVECNVYFEPYYHVLRALQIMNEDKFPMKRYIIDVEPDVNPPAYLTLTTEIKCGHYNFAPLIPQNWPSAAQLRLDDSQYRAFQAAITKEFCVIQGPPGTGKTYIGLKVAKVLLKNRMLWNTNRGPILVICFTNHALDQFLEGICDYTDKLIRVGGQSKSAKLKKHNIREMRTNFKRERAANELLFKRRIAIKECMAKIRNHQVVLDAINSHTRVLDFQCFQDIDPRMANSWFASAKRSEIISWLMGGRTQGERNAEHRQNRLTELEARMQNEDDENNANSDIDEEFFDAEGQEQREIDDGDELDVKIDITSINTFLLTTAAYEDRIKQLEIEIQQIQAKTEGVNTYAVYDEIGMKAQELDKAAKDLEYLMWRLDQFRNGQYPPRPLAANLTNRNILTSNERWGLYFFWLSLYRAQLLNDLNVMEEKYRKLHREYEEVKQIEDIRLMKEMYVVGMTTTGAAKFQTLLQALACPIVIVEEAAEVLESHVVVSLTNDCQQLILIGDHQQLRPTTAEYRIAKKYNLEISLFERMLKNGIHCQQLEVQHRMRPEIARLIVPAIYPRLDNHLSVESYPPVQGVAKSLFFLTHTEREEAMDDTGSRKNVYEAKFLIMLARHLILQGYEPTEITILATYSGQMFCLWRERRPYPMLKDVRITVVDNFQGEENKIILLSLVRSNADGNVGFLKIDNRICVALSRAKEGMFILGNMDILTQSNAVWPQIKAALEENGSLGTDLTLQCQVHPDQQTEVRKAEDFLKVPEGGCSKLCAKQLDCGHTCASMCHVADRDHTKYKCKFNCTKILCELDHPCPDFCFQECKLCMVPMQVTLKCGHTHMLPCHMHDTSNYKCDTIVDVVLDCGHAAKKPCHKSMAKFPCPHPCEVRKLCGHACDRSCHIHDDPDHLQSKCFKPCAKYRKDCSQKSHQCPLACYQECLPCDVKVRKHRTVCEHVFDVPCHANIDDLVCPKPCKRKLDCGHNCRKKCYEPCDDCQAQVYKEIEACGHTVKAKCSETPTRAMCKGDCTFHLTCGHRCDKKCNETCTTKCRHPVDNPHPAACSHTFQIPCYKVSEKYKPTSYMLLRHCSQPCTEMLDCGHKCSGTCGECAQGRIHKTCQERCGATLICGHDCEVPCRITCQPCNKPCIFKCVHSKCGKKCGEPCTACKETCPRRCAHVRCTKRCGEPCNCPPCTEPCARRLRCGHPCIGFCGDPCILVCRICQPEHETFEIQFGNEDEPDARFVMLVDCGHIIESDAMDQWLSMKPDVDSNKPNEITVKRCPKCNTVITNTQRYSHYIKATFRDIINIKKKLFGKEKDNETNRVELQVKITEVAHLNVRLYTESKFLRVILQELQTTLKATTKQGRRNPLNNSLLETYKAQVQIIERLIQTVTKAKLPPTNLEQCVERLDYLLYFIKRQNNRITKQEILDLELELNRFESYAHLWTIENSPHWTTTMVRTKTDVKIVHADICRVLGAVSRYTGYKNDYLRERLKKLCDLVDKSIKLAEQERLMIVQAMDLGKGRWFKCPNGHYYAIGSCGGAMEESKCPECGERIGGTNHSLLSTNRFAGEIDGAEHPAWSDTANMNMRNFHFDD